MSKASGTASPGVAITGAPPRSWRDAGMFITGEARGRKKREAAAGKSLSEVSAQTAAYLQLEP